MLRHEMTQKKRIQLTQLLFEELLQICIFFISKNEDGPEPYKNVILAMAIHEKMMLKDMQQK